MRAAVASLLVVHALLLAWLASVHSPLIDEPAHLASGLCHWRTFSFDLYRVNPPLVRAVAAVPLLTSRQAANWDAHSSNPYSRAEFSAGKALFETNDKDNFKMTKDDVKFRGGGACIMRIPLDTLNINGAKPKEPGKLDVIGCEIKFNAMIWVEDLRELKALYGPDGKNYATGTLKFLGPNSK